MSIKVTLGQLQAALDTKALSTLSEIVPPGAQLFRIARLLDSIERELGEANKQRVALFKRYGQAVKDSDGKPTSQLTMAGASEENLQAFNESMAKLFATEVDLPHEPIDWSRLGEEAQSKLTVQIVRVLGPLIVEGGEAACGMPLKVV